MRPREEDIDVDVDRAASLVCAPCECQRRAERVGHLALSQRFVESHNLVDDVLGYSPDRCDSRPTLGHVEN